MQAARDLVRAVVELTSRMQHGHDDFGGGNPFLRVNIDRNPTPVVRNRYGLIRVDGDHNLIAMTGKRLVDRVVHHLENHVVEPGSVIGVTDVHSGSFAHRIKTL